MFFLVCYKIITIFAVQNNITTTNDNNNDIIRVLVINTGMNTNRANLLLNLSFPKQENYSLYKDTIIFMLIMFIIFIGAIIFNIKLNSNVSNYFLD